MALTPGTPEFKAANQQLAASLGFTGQAGGGAVDAWLAQNPQLIGTYTMLRRQQLEPGYVPNAQLQQYLTSQGGGDNGVVPVGQVEPFNQYQKDALTKLGTDLSGQFLNSANQYAGTTQQALNQATPLINQGTQALTPAALSAGVQSYMNPYTQQVVDNTNNTIRREGERSGAQIKSDFAGNYGSSAMGVRQGLLDEAVINAIAGNTANLNNQGYNTALSSFLGQTNTEQNRALEGAKTYLGQSALAGELANQNYGLRTSNLQGQLGAGTAIQQQNQKSLDILRPEIYGQQNYSQTQLDNLSRLLGAFPGGTYQSTTAPGNSPLSSALGLGLTAGGITSALGASAGMSGAVGIGAGLLGLLSDIRAKHNIVKTGTRNGFNIYEFSYLGSNRRFSGVMAHEVEKIMPGAVTEHDGMKRVNYSMIGVPFREVRA